MRPSKIRPDQWLLVALALGLALRSYHYLICPAVWHDEAAVMVNVLGLSFGEMFGPLIHAEAAPPLFLVAERAAVLLLGDGELAFRLIPFLAACGSMLLFAGVARRVLEPVAAALAVGLFAVSDRLLWHACEAKPYSLDVFWAAVALYWMVRTEGWAVWQRCLPAAVVAPVAIGSSFPACFVAGGLLVGLLRPALKASWPNRASYLVLTSAVAVSFIALALGPVAAQRCGAMEQCWTKLFPDWSRPWTAPLWAAASTVDVFRYCLMPSGQVMAAFVAIGSVAVGRFRPDGRSLLAVALLPIVLAFVAALLHKYPYGGARVVVFTAPAVCLLGAIGVRVALPWLVRRSRVAAGAAAVAVLLPFLSTALRVVAPWERVPADTMAEYVLTHRAAGEPVLFNHWEYEYYLRSIPSEWRLWNGTFESTDLSDSSRIWILHTGPGSQSSLPFVVPRGWELAQTSEYPGGAVFTLHRVETDSRHLAITSAPCTP